VQISAAFQHRNFKGIQAGIRRIVCIIWVRFWVPRCIDTWSDIALKLTCGIIRTREENLARKSTFAGGTHAAAQGKGAST
jgi:hypothetical protein